MSWNPPTRVGNRSGCGRCIDGSAVAVLLLFTLNLFSYMATFFFRRFVPIPGTSSVERLDENVHSLDLILTSDDLDRRERAAPKGAVSGDRYEPGMMQLING